MKSKTDSDVFKHYDTMITMKAFYFIFYILVQTITEITVQDKLIHNIQLR